MQAIQMAKKLNFVQRNTEMKGFGPEPEAEIDFTKLDKIVYQQALSWYARFMEADEGAEWLALELKERGFNPKQISQVKRSNITPTVYAIARLLQRGCLLEPYSSEFLMKKVRNVLAKAGASIEPSETVKQPKDENVVSIVERTETKAKTFRADIDELIDQITTKVVKLDDVNWFKQFEVFGIKPAHAKVLVEIYTAQRDDVINYPEDYANFTKPEYKALVAMYSKVVSELTTWATSKKVRETKKTRTPKRQSFKKEVKTQLNATKTLKFKANDGDLGVVSVKPSTILGSQVLITFDTKYSVLSCYFAQDRAGLSVKGTTILNYDETKSFSQRCGRSKTQIKTLVDATKTSLQKGLDSLKGTKLAIKSRTSAETILVKVLK